MSPSATSDTVVDDGTGSSLHPNRDCQVRSFSESSVSPVRVKCLLLYSESLSSPKVLVISTSDLESGGQTTPTDGYERESQRLTTTDLPDLCVPSTGAHTDRHGPT